MPKTEKGKYYSLLTSILTRTVLSNYTGSRCVKKSNYPPKCEILLDSLPLLDSPLDYDRDDKQIKWEETDRMVNEHVSQYEPLTAAGEQLDQAVSSQLSHSAGTLSHKKTQSVQSIYTM